MSVSQPKVQQKESAASRIAGLLRRDAFVSGADIAAQIGVSRAAVSERIRSMRAAGLPVVAVRGCGYRLTDDFSALDVKVVINGLSETALSALKSIELRWSVDSTNRHLAREPESKSEPGPGPGPGPGTGSIRVCLTEHQSSGRGRRGRAWVSRLGASLTFSLAWTTDLEPQALQGLSLRIGLAVADAVEAAGVRGVGLKWPNDLVAEGRKLGGILMELNASAGGHSTVIIGIGINVSQHVGDAQIDQPWTSLQALNGGDAVDRSALTAILIDHLSRCLSDFNPGASYDLPAAWARFDVLANQAVRIFQGDGSIDGIARGVDETGALVVDTHKGARRFLGGEVSVRATPADKGPAS